jgi:tetratricopeptide (TPR) repeat protein
VKAKGDALKTFRDLKDRSFYMADMLGGYGEALVLAGQGGDALKNLEEALALARELKNDTLVAQTLNYQGDLFFYRGDYKSARPLYEQALQAATRSKDLEKVLLSRFNLSKVEIKEGRATSAVAVLRSLGRQAESQGLKYVAVESSIYLAEALMSTRDDRGARQELERTQARAEKLGLLELQARIHHLQGTMFRLSGSNAEAASHFHEAARLLDDLRKEPGCDKLLERTDLKAIYSDSTRAAQGARS